MWNPTVGLGTVTHEYIGYLLPMGPFFAVLHLLGVPVWVAQRLWLGSILFAAGMGILYLSRVARPPWARARSRRRSPTCSRRTSCSTRGASPSSSCPGPGFPSCSRLTIVALRRGGWREPALFAFVVALVSGINASSIIYVGVAPSPLAPLRRRRVARVHVAPCRSARGSASRCSPSGPASGGSRASRWRRRTGSTSSGTPRPSRRRQQTSNPADIFRGLGLLVLLRLRPPRPVDQLGHPLHPEHHLAGDVLRGARARVVAAAFVRWRERAYFLLLLFVGHGPLGRALPVHAPHARSAA